MLLGVAFLLAAGLTPIASLPTVEVTPPAAVNSVATEAERTPGQSFDATLPLLAAVTAGSSAPKPPAPPIVSPPAAPPDAPDAPLPTPISTGGASTPPAPMPTTPTVTGSNPLESAPSEETSEGSSAPEPDAAP